MVFPAACLAVNLIWPRYRGVKAIGLALLVLTVYLHGFSGLNPLDRAVGLAERIVTSEQTGTPQQVVRELHLGRDLAHKTMFEVALALTLAVFFAATPVDLLTSRQDRSRRKTEAVDLSLSERSADKN